MPLAKRAHAVGGSSASAPAAPPSARGCAGARLRSLLLEHWPDGDLKKGRARTAFAPFLAMKHSTFARRVAWARKTVPLFPIVPLVPIALLAANAIGLVSLRRRVKRLETHG